MKPLVPVDIARPSFRFHPLARAIYIILRGL